MTYFVSCPYKPPFPSPQQSVFIPKIPIPPLSPTHSLPTHHLPILNSILNVPTRFTQVDKTFPHGFEVEVVLAIPGDVGPVVEVDGYPGSTDSFGYADVA